MPVDDAILERITAMLAGELDAAETAALRALVDADPQLRAEFDQLERAWRLFDALANAPVEPSPELEAQAREHFGATTTAANASGHTDLSGIHAQTQHAADGPALSGVAKSEEHATMSATSPISTNGERPRQRGALHSLLTFLQPVGVAAAILLVVAVALKLNAPGNAPDIHVASGDNNAAPLNPNGGDGNGPNFSHVEPPDPLNPIGSGRVSIHGTTDGAFYREAGEQWQPLTNETVLPNANTQIRTGAGAMVSIAFGDTNPSTITIDGNSQISLVRDPIAEDGLCVEMLSPGRVYVDIQSDKTVTARTPNAYTALTTGVAAELSLNANLNTDVAVAQGAVLIASFESEQVNAVRVGAGQIASLAINAKPFVRANLNTNWVANWAKIATAQQDLSVELPLQAGETGRDAGNEHAVLVATDPEYDNVPFVINKHHVEVSIDGQVATTTINEFFQNTTDRTLEGVFHFPLPTDAAISGLSMWIDGREVVGEFEERTIARRIYEEYKYQRRDPALLEWMEGNKYRLSIFPILPQEEKHIRIQYTEVLTPKVGVMRYTYPLVSDKLKGNPVRDFALIAEVNSAAATCVSHKMRMGRAMIPFRGMVEAANYTPGRDFVLDIPVNGNAFELEQSKLPSAEQGHFAAYFTPTFDVPTIEREPGNVLVLVDTSGSMNRDLWAFQMAVLDRVLAGLDADDRFDVLTYHWQTKRIGGEYLENTAANRQAIVAATAHEPRFGATDLHRALTDALAAVDPSEPTTLILLGDGIATMGIVEGPKLMLALENANFGTVDPDAPGMTYGLAREQGAKLRLFPVAIGSEISREMLDTLAGDFGGLVVDANQQDDPVAVANNLHRALITPALTDLTVTVSGEGITAGDVFPNNVAPLTTGSQVAFVGRYAIEGAQAEATFTFSGRLNGQPWTQAHTTTLRNSAIDAAHVDRFWAKRAIDGLQAQLDAGVEPGDTIRETIIEYSKKYQIASRHTSLLVLENDEEFKRWDIERTANAAKLLEVKDGEAAVNIADLYYGDGARGDIRVMPAGSDVWLNLGDLLQQGVRKLPVNAKIATAFDTTLTLSTPTGEQVVIGEKQVVIAGDLAIVAAYARAHAAANTGEGNDNDPDNDTNNTGDANTTQTDVPAEFVSQAEGLADAIAAMRRAIRTQQIATWRQRLLNDRKDALFTIESFLQTYESIAELDVNAEQMRKLAHEMKAAIEADIDSILLVNFVDTLTPRSYRKEAAAKAEERLGALAENLALEESDGDWGELETRMRRMTSEQGRGTGFGGGSTGEAAQESANADDEDDGSADHRNGGSAPATGSDSGSTEPAPNTAPRPQADPAEPRGFATGARDSLRNERHEAETAGRELQDSIEQLQRADDAELDEERQQDLQRELPPADRNNGTNGQPGATNDSGASSTAPERRVAGLDFEAAIARLATLSKPEALTELEAQLKGYIEADMPTGMAALSTSLMPSAGPRRLLSTAIEQFTMWYQHALQSTQAATIADVATAPEGALAARVFGDTIARVQAEDAAWSFPQNGTTTFVLDVSYTMGLPLSAKQREALNVPAEVRDTIVTKLDLARYELTNALSKLQPGSHFALILLARDLFYLNNNGHFTKWGSENGFDNARIQATPTTVAHVARLASRVPADDVCNLPGLLTALADGKLYPDKGVHYLGKTVYLISDGWTSWSPDTTGYLDGTGMGNGEQVTDESVVRDALVDRNETWGLRINTVGIGSHNAEHLRAIATLTGGEYLNTTGGNNSATKPTDERPADRVARKIADLAKTPMNTSGWLALADWAGSKAVNDYTLGIEVFMAWSKANPTNHLIFEALGEWLQRNGRADEAIRAFTTIVEGGYATGETHRWLGNLFRANGMLDESVAEFRLSRDFRPDIAIAYFTEAQVHIQLGNPLEARRCYYSLLEAAKWPARYLNVHQRAARELVVLLQQLEYAATKAGDEEKAAEWKSEREGLCKDYGVPTEWFVGTDVIVILDWDTDGTDVDLWMTRNGNDEQKCFYSQPTPNWGVRLHEDCTQGFGPEFITLKDGATGEYTIRIHYYGNAANPIRSYCHVKVIVKPGTDAEQIFEHHIKLEGAGVVKAVQTLKFEGGELIED